MNIIDMPFVAPVPVPTNSVENGCHRPEKIGKSCRQDGRRERVTETRERERKSASGERGLRERELQRLLKSLVAEEACWSI